MASTSAAAAHVFLSTARFHDLVGQGVITKAPKAGAYDLDEVRKEYILHIRKGAAGIGKSTDGLSAARADLAREQAAGFAMKNAVARGDFVPMADVVRETEEMLASFRERALSIPGKLAALAEMRSGAEVEELLQLEIHELLDELSRPDLRGQGVDRGNDTGGSKPGARGAKAGADAEPDRVG